MKSALRTPLATAYALLLSTAAAGAASAVDVWLRAVFVIEEVGAHDGRLIDRV